MDMIERVAEAMWQAEWARAGNGGRRRVPWSEIAPTDQDRYRFVARAAIEAMREPTEAMAAACWPLHHPWGNNAPDPSDRPLSFEDMLADVTADWKAMIDAALSSPPVAEEPK